MSFLEIIGVVVSAAAIWLTARRRMACWPVGLMSVALYGWIFYDAKLYSDFLLQGAFAVAQVYGWWHWRQAAVGDNAPRADIRIVKPSTQRLLLGLVLGGVGGTALGAIMAAKTDAALPYMDAWLASFSLVAQYWTARRYLANWALWSVVNAVYVGMFAFKHLYPTAGLYLLFLVLGVIGWRDWRSAEAESAGQTKAQDGARTDRRDDAHAASAPVDYPPSYQKEAIK